MKIIRLDRRTAEDFIFISVMLGAVALFMAPGPVVYDWAKVRSTLSPFFEGAEFRLAALLSFTAATSILARKSFRQLAEFSLWLTCLFLFTPLTLGLAAGFAIPGTWPGVAWVMATLIASNSLAVYLAATFSQLLEVRGY